MSDLLKNIDARTRLAGTNKLEILLFSLGQLTTGGKKELFGINVFKVREVMRTPSITVAPDMPPQVRGMVSLRGQLVPVVDLSSFFGMATSSPPEFMIVTEYNGHVQGFLVESVDTILRLDWSQMRVPPEMISNRVGGPVTAITELADDRLVMMLDVEKVLASTTNIEDDTTYAEISKGVSREDAFVVFADDSSVARNQIAKTLDLMGVRHHGYVNGKTAYEGITKMAREIEATGGRLSDKVSLILTDVEMPEMDGYMLTKMLKSNRSLNDIPILMHSSLSGSSNQQLGRSVGVDDYINKFEPRRLAESISRFIDMWPRHEEMRKEGEQ